MARRTEPEKRPGFFAQLRTLYRFTVEVYRWLPAALIAMVAVAAILGALAGVLIPPAAPWSVALWTITGVLLGILGALVIMTRLSTRAMYRKIDGMPGAAGQILSTSLGRRWQAGEMPVGVNPRTQDAVYRAIGRGGVVIVGEGARGRLTRLIADERARIGRVASGVPITVIHVGRGEGEVPIDRLARTIKALPNRVDKATVATVVKRVGSVSQSLTSLPIPKGIDPNRVRPPRPR